MSAVPSPVVFLRREWPSLLMLASLVVMHAAAWVRRLTAREGVIPTGPEPLPAWTTQPVEWGRLLAVRADLALALIGVMLIGLVVLVAGTFRLARVLDRWRRGEGRLWLGRLTWRAPWGVWDVTRLVIVVAFVAHLVAMGQWAWELLRPERRLDEHARMLIHTALVDGLVLAGVWVLLREHGLSWRHFGLSLNGLVGTLRHAVGWYVTAVPVLVGVLLLTMLVVRLSGWEPSPQPVFELLYAEERPAMVRYAMWMVMLLGPVAEECFFRGLAYTALKRRLGVGRAMTVSAFFFALLHIDPVGFVPIMVLGMLLTYLYEQTGSLVVPIVVHAAHNGLMVGVVSLMRAAIQAAA